MYITGLCSISFRNANIDEIINECKKSEIKCIEWGGDIHVPSNDLSNAKEVSRKTKESGIQIITYGSYYILGTGMDFSKVLKTAEILSAKIIRIWGGNKRRDLIGPLEYEQLVKEAREISIEAKNYNIKIALECHINTITEDPQSAMEFIKIVDSGNLFVYFQPNQFQTIEENIQRAKILSDKVIAIHMFNWKGNYRFPLKNGIEEWKKYLDVFKKENRDIPVFLEFVYGDSFKNLINECQSMKAIIY